MTENADKILSIVQKHPEYSLYVSRVKSEIDQLEELDVLDKDEPLKKYLLRAHRQVETGESTPGKSNKLNLALAYLMGLTKEAPDGDFVLEKRRTYGRAGFPDIDMDFCYLRRKEIVDYIIEKYGADKVAHIGTVQKLKVKAAVRRAVKVLDPTNSMQYDNEGKLIKSEKNFNFALENEILDTLPKIMKKHNGEFVESVDDACQTYKRFGEYMRQYPEVRRIASAIEGTLSGYGCLSKDTVVKTDIGWARIDEIDDTVQLCYLDANGDQQYTRQFLPRMTGNKICYKMRLKNGDFIKVTDEHMIFTDQGCVPFEEIRKNPEQYKVLSVGEA